MKKLIKHKLFILISLGMIWGASFILIKKSLTVFSFSEVALLRLSIAGLVLLPFSIKAMKELTKKELLYLMEPAFIGNGIPAFIFAYSQQYINSNEAAILNSLTPIFTVIISYLFFKAPESKNIIIGIILGFLGSLILIVSSEGNYKVHLLSYLLLILATIMYGFNTNFVKNYCANIKSSYIASISYFIFIFLLPFIVNNNFINKLSNNYFGLLYVLLLGIFCTGLPLIWFNVLLKQVSATYSSYVTYIIPVFAFFWAAIDNEIFTIFHIIAIFLILSGVFIINKKDKIYAPK
ncbi:MAG: DMT family transporter [Bacteroidales bacterium]|nr:DMT family transporter [Bacteroidales bacterium]